MEAEEARTVQLCLCPLLIYALAGENPLGASPRAQWRLLQAFEEGLHGEDAFSGTLVEGLKSNLHKFHAHYRDRYAAADAATLTAALQGAALTLKEQATSGIDPAGYRRTLLRFAAYLADRAGDPAAEERQAGIVGMLSGADPENG